MEYRYYSGAHDYKKNNIIKELKSLNLRVKSVLDVGCGGGFWSNIMVRMGAEVKSIDYSPYAIKFAKERYPNLDLSRVSANDIEKMGVNPDIITIFDVIEHLLNPDEFLKKAFKILKPGGKIIIATDNTDDLFSRWPFNRVKNLLLRTSSPGRAYRVIKKAEEYRRQFKNYHFGHISSVSYDELSKKLKDTGFKINKVKVYSLVSAPILELISKFLPYRIRGDHMIITASVPL